MNLQEAQKHLSKEPKIAEVIRITEVPDFTPNRKIYFNLLESIVSQQLSVKVADIIFNRFLNLFADKHPHPEQLLNLEFENLRSVGLSNQKANYLRNVALFSQQHNLEAKAWDSMSDNEIIEFLTQIKGVGKWTSEMLLMFTLGRPDVFPHADLGIQQAMAKLYNLEETGKPLINKMIEFAEPWRPYRTIACRYLWKWKDTK